MLIEKAREEAYWSQCSFGIVQKYTLISTLNLDLLTVIAQLIFSYLEIMAD